MHRRVEVSKVCGRDAIMGRMIATGRGRHLFDRQHLRTALEESYPSSGETPGQKLSDVEGLIDFHIRAITAWLDELEARLEQGQ